MLSLKHKSENKNFNVIKKNNVYKTLIFLIAVLNFKSFILAHINIRQNILSAFFFCRSTNNI